MSRDDLFLIPYQPNQSRAFNSCISKSAKYLCYHCDTQPRATKVPNPLCVYFILQKLLTDATSNPSLRQPDWPCRRFPEVSDDAVLRRPRLLHHRSAGRLGEGADEARRSHHLPLDPQPVQLLRIRGQEVPGGVTRTLPVHREPAEGGEVTGSADPKGGRDEDGRDRGDGTDDGRTTGRPVWRGITATRGWLLQSGSQHQEVIHASQRCSPGEQFGDPALYPHGPAEELHPLPGAGTLAPETCRKTL